MAEAWSDIFFVEKQYMFFSFSFFCFPLLAARNGIEHSMRQEFSMSHTIFGLFFSIGLDLHAKNLWIIFTRFVLQ